MSVAPSRTICSLSRAAAADGSARATVARAAEADRDCDTTGLPPASRALRRHADVVLMPARLPAASAGMSSVQIALTGSIVRQQAPVVPCADVACDTCKSSCSAGFPGRNLDPGPLRGPGRGADGWVVRWSWGLSSRVWFQIDHRRWSRGQGRAVCRQSAPCSRRRWPHRSCPHPRRRPRWRTHVPPP